jgi:Family of unknown function (DUF5989)
MQQPHDSDSSAFAREAARKRSPVIAELWWYLRSNKKWWLTPMVLILLSMGMLALAGSSAAAPFIYTLF